MRSRFRGALFAAACALAAVSGCATTPDAGMDKDKKYKTVCADEAPTGSHIPRLRCHREIDVNERRNRDRATMEKVQFESNRPLDSSGGVSGGSGGRQRVLGSSALVSTPSPGRSPRAAR